tara:strand:- start:515 stop:2962 length:2448 start_codon:yes stop_codon:yes gene_type:complete
MSEEIIKLVDNAFRRLGVNRGMAGSANKLVELIGGEVTPEEITKAVSEIRDQRLHVFNTFIQYVNYGTEELEYKQVVNYNVLHDILRQKHSDLDNYILGNPYKRATVKKLIVDLDKENYSPKIPIPFFTPKERQLFITVIDGVTRDRRTSTKIDLTKFASKLTTTRATDLRTRNNTYKYWNQVKGEFKTMIDAINASGTIPLSNGKTIKEIPSYIITMGPLIIKKIINPNHPILLDVLRHKYISDELNDIIESEYVAIGQFDDEGGQTGYGAEISQRDTTLTDTSPLQQLRDNIISMSDVWLSEEENISLDPLLTIILQDEEFPTVMNAEQIETNVEKVIAQLQSGIDAEDLEFLAQSFNKYKKIISDNLNRYQPISRKTYSFAIMDGPEISQKVLTEALEDTPAVKPTYEYLVAEYTGDKYTITTKIAKNYSKMINEINKSTNEVIRFFTDHYDVEKYITEDSKTVYSVPQQQKHAKAKRVTGLGTPSIPIRRIPEGQIGKNTAGLTDALTRYYFTALTEQNINLDDLPNFTKTKQYNALKRLLANDPVTLVTKEIASGRSRPKFSMAQFQDMNKFLKIIKQGYIQRYDANNSVYADKFISGIINLIRPIGIQRFRPIERNLSILLGAILHQSWEKSVAAKDDPESPKFRGKTLEYWNNTYHSAEEDKKDLYLSFANLHRLFNEPIMVEYLQSEGAVTGQTQENSAYYIVYGQNGIVDNLTKVSENLPKLASAVLYSYDLIRKHNNLPIYSGYLDVNSPEDIEYLIDTIDKKYSLDVYGKDVDTIVKSHMTMKELVSTLGIPHEVVYHIRGMFR